MASQPRAIFVSVPVQDLSASVAFFGAIGFEFNEAFTDDSGTCMVVNEQAYVMLLSQARFADFATKPIADPAAANAAILGVSADSREAVDALVDAALAAGAEPGRDPMDMGSMYQRSFHDPDGYLWEIVWMDEQASAEGPPDMAQSA